RKIVLVTGATSGIGKAVARIFSKKGYDLVITGRRKERLKEIKDKYEGKYANQILPLTFDVRDKEAVKESLKSLKGEWKNIDLLINNAGLASGIDPIHKAKLEDWDRMIDTNVKGLLYVTRIVSEHMVKRQDGHIINVCSTAGHEVYPGGNVYCASKHAVDAITRAMRLDFYDKNIRVSQISPGAVEETEFSMVRYDGDKKKASIYNDYNPLTSRDVAKMVYFMASQPKHVNIQDLIVMGTQQASATVFDKSGRRFDDLVKKD
ncbi:MAG: SDR family NAD(P)-dependent oxidoreductase, partial [Bacteroidota bacterium]